LIGSGPIVIGQACEFDYSGTQGAKALKQERYEVVLVNSNPATVMTDPELADRTYVEPLDVDVVAAIIEREKPDALLPTLGGQTALNIALGLHARGVLERHGVELIGASVEAIRKAEDRALFNDAMRKIGLNVARSRLARNMADAEQAVSELGFPLILRPSFTLGGSGGGIVYDPRAFDAAIRWAFSQSPTHECLIEESLLGWKEYELEVIRDRADNFAVICSIENFDPMGVHTGDSITVAPAMTLTDKEYQRLRDASRAIITEIGVDTGGSNIQFAVNPRDGRVIVVEMNPRVSRSSALASKATGYPIAKIAAKLAVGYRHERGIRAEHRLRGDQGAALRVREVRGLRSAPDHADEIGGRGDGDRPHFQAIAAQSHAFARERPRRPDVAAGPHRLRGLRAQAGGTRGGRRGTRQPAAARGRAGGAPDRGVAPGAAVRDPHAARRSALVHHGCAARGL
jgi:carbamoyl-phosphate synthase large subunit